MKFVLVRVENIVGKGENLVTHFSHLPRIFLKSFFSRAESCLKSGLCGKELTPYQTSKFRADIADDFDFLNIVGKQH